MQVFKDSLVPFIEYIVLDSGSPLLEVPLYIHTSGHVLIICKQCNAFKKYWMVIVYHTAYCAVFEPQVVGACCNDLHGLGTNQC